MSAHKNAQKLSVLQTTLNISSSDEDLGNKVLFALLHTPVSACAFLDLGCALPIPLPCPALPL